MVVPDISESACCMALLKPDDEVGWLCILVLAINAAITPSSSLSVDDKPLTGDTSPKEDTFLNQDACLVEDATLVTGES